MIKQHEATSFTVFGVKGNYVLTLGYNTTSSRNFILTKSSSNNFCVTFKGVSIFTGTSRHFRYITEYISVSDNYINEEDLPIHDRIAIAESLAILNSRYSEV